MRASRMRTDDLRSSVLFCCLELSSQSLIKNTNRQQQERFDRQDDDLYDELYFLTTARIDAKSKFNTIFFKKGIENAEICSIIVVWGITTMNNYEFLEKIGFSSNEAKVYGTLIKHKVLNGYEIAKLSGVARSLVYEVINRLVAKGAVIRIDGEPNFYKPIEYQDLIRSIKEENEKKNIACAERELQQLATENADVDYVMNIVGEEKYVAKAKELIDSAQSGNFAVHLARAVRSAA